MPGFRGELGEGESGKQRRRGNRYGETPQGLEGTWVQVDMVRGAGMSGRGWRMAGADDVQVVGASHRDTRWGAIEKLEGFNDEWLCVGRRLKRG